MSSERNVEMEEDPEAVELEREHHKRAEVAYNRPDYREARWERAVKVYTVNQESRYLLVQNVHALGVTQDLLQQFALYGDIEEYRLLDEYPSEPYTDVYWIKFVAINSARVAKKRLDSHSFFGKPLHVCYAPEYETVQDTREKLQQRRKIIAQKTRETFENAQKAKVKHAKVEQATTCSSVSQQQPNTVLGSRHDPNLSAGGSCDFTPQPHDNQVIPGLPPLPELPLPPTHIIPVRYSSAIAGSEGVLHSTTGEEVPGKRTSISQPCERPSAGQNIPLATQAKPKKDSVLFNPAGLSTSERISEYLATADSKAGGETWLVGKRISECQPMPVPSSSRITDLHTPRATSQTRVTGKSAIHKATCCSPSGMTGTRIAVSPPPPVVMTGNSSLDKSVQSVRDQMTKVWRSSLAPPLAPAMPNPKKRKRI